MLDTESKQQSQWALTFLQAVVTAEMAVITLATFVYMRQVVRFNRAAELPDVHRDLLARAQRPLGLQGGGDEDDLDVRAPRPPLSRARP